MSDQDNYPAHQDYVYDNAPREPWLGDPDFVAGSKPRQFEGNTN